MLLLTEKHFIHPCRKDTLSGWSLSVVVSRVCHAEL